MVMQYLIQRNDEYIDRMDEFENKLDKLIDLLRVLEYNVNELQATVRTLRTTDAQDAQLKEEFNAKRQRQFPTIIGGRLKLL